MFDDQPNQPVGAVPPNLPVEPDDMFSGVEKSTPLPPAQPAPPQPAPERPDALSAGVLKRKTPPGVSVALERPLPGSDNPAPAEATRYPAKEPVLGKIIFFVFGSAVLLGLVVGGWWAYDRYIAPGSTPTKPVQVAPPGAAAEIIPPPGHQAETPPLSQPVAETPPPAPVSTTSISTSVTNDTILFGVPVDTDKDGLDDQREREIGTDPNKSDTDNDGLSDGDEVIIWKTNPLNPDTDGDGYPDGQEVRSGFNPLGNGRLFTAPVGSTSTVSVSSSKKQGAVAR